MGGPANGCQIITHDMKFNEEFANFVSSNELGKKARAYHIVSIIGGQSSGKSTLLNQLFGTSFEMMDSKRGRQQTTKGIWCACAKSGEILVMDVEGTDGREKEDQKAFEGKSALFSLALTDIMMINMWMHEVGRFNAANLPLIKTVIEAHLRLMFAGGYVEKHVAKPLLLFVLRDCDDSTPVERLKEDVVKDIEKIWKDVSKPANFPDAQLTDFFNIECKALPHYVYCKEQWKEEVESLARQFDDDAREDYIFRGHGEKEVPADGIADFAGQLWRDIEADNELDLPTHRKMLSMVRCERKRQMKFAAFQAESESSSWPHETKSSDFKKETEQRLQRLQDEYVKETAGYDAEEQEKAKMLLTQDFWKYAEDRFHSLVREEREAIEEESKTVFTALLPPPSRSPDVGFDKKLKQQVEELQEKFFRALEEIIPASAPWKSLLKEPEGAEVLLRKHLEREAESMRKEFAMLVVADSQRAMKKSLDKELVRIIDKASPNMWQLIREAKATAINGSMSNMKKLLRDIGREEKMDKEEKQLQHFACELVHDKISNETMKDNFENKMFACFDSKFNHHKTRVWRLWDNPEQDFEAAKRAGLDLLDAFAEDQLYEEEEERPEGYTPSLYIPPPAADQLRDKFFRLLQPELVWALESKRNSSTHNSLMVAFLLLLLGWDELLWLLTNPLYLLTFLLFAAAAAGYYFTQKIGNLSQIAAMLGLNLPGAAAAAGGGGGGEKGVNLEQFRGMPSGRETGRAGVRSYPGTDKSQ